MKKTLSIILITLLVIILTGTYLEVNAADLCTVSITTQNPTVTEGQKQVVILINLDEYNGAGDLGYQGTLEYDKNIFENVTMNSLNDWENIDYEPTTGNFLSTTKSAQKGTTIAEITLTIKDGITAQNTTVNINDLMFADGDTSANFNQSLTFNFEQNTSTEEPSTDPDDKPEEQPGDNQEEQPGDNQEEQPGQTPDGDNNNQNEETPNTNSEAISNSQSNKNDTILIEGATNEDRTTATSTIPQTGGISTLVVVGVIAVIGIACYIRYRTIQVK